MAIRGTLTSMSVPDLLQFMAAGRKTGDLKFSRGKIIKQIYLENGLIVGSNTNDPKEYFGQVLIHYGKVNEENLKAAMEFQRASGGKLGEILVAQGALTQDDMLATLRTRTLDIIYDLFLWEDAAYFEFYDNEPLPDDLIRIQVEPNALVMEGIYRIDELTRFRQLIPSDRTIFELGVGWTSSVSMGKEVRQLLYFIEKRMSVAEIAYQMHASTFHVYSQLYELVNKDMARVVGEAPEEGEGEPADLPETVTEMIAAARLALKENQPERALAITHRILDREPKNSEAQGLLLTSELRFVKQVYASGIDRHAIPKLLVGPDGLTNETISSQEGFMLSRINGEWDVQSILSICPFREADSLRMIQNLLAKKIIGF